MLRTCLTLVAVAGIALASHPASARDQIRIVGSSTVFPFATAVAERFGRSTHFKTPVIESTGSVGGFRLFCAARGDAPPDIANASRRITKAEIARCARNGSGAITEVKIGYDGIVVANSRNAERFAFTKRQLFLALAARLPDGHGGLENNPYRQWSDIDPGLPEKRIVVLGPPPTSGTRDSFVDLVMRPGCAAVAAVRTLGAADRRTACRHIRRDGIYIEFGENDMLFVRELEADTDAVGIFGFSYLEQNADQLQGTRIDGVLPSFDSIADRSYPLSRPLFFYVKAAHVGVVPGIRAYVDEFTSEAAWGDGGYLARRGLIPLPEDERQHVREQAMALENNIGM